MKNVLLTSLTHNLNIDNGRRLNQRIGVATGILTHRQLGGDRHRISQVGRVLTGNIIIRTMVATM